jgi:hypothetical protein
MVWCIPRFPGHGIFFKNHGRIIFLEHHTVQNEPEYRGTFIKISPGITEFVITKNIPVHRVIPPQHVF